MFVRRITLSLVLFSVTAFASQTTFAQNAAFRTFGFDASYFPASGDYTGSGNGTHLGNHTFLGNVASSGEFFPEPFVFFAGTFSGSQVAIAANGDELHMDILEGEVTLLIDPDTSLVYGEWKAKGDVTGGSGRFEHASGELEVIAINPPFDPFASAEWKFNWTINGRMNLGKKK